MKTSNLIVYCICLIALLFAILGKAIDNNTYFICISIMISACIISTEIKDKNYEKDKFKQNI